MVNNYIDKKNQITKQAFVYACTILIILFLLYFLFFNHATSLLKMILIVLIFFISVMSYISKYSKLMIAYFNSLLDELILEKRDAQAYNEVLAYAYEHRKSYDITPIQFYLIGLMQSFDKELIKQLVEKEKRNIKNNDFRMQISFHLMDLEEKKEQADAYYNHMMMRPMNEQTRLFHQIQLDFFTQHYDEAIHQLKSYETYSLYDNIYKNYYMGLSYYYLHDYENALPCFHQVIQYGNTLGVVKVVKDCLKEMS